MAEDFSFLGVFEDKGTKPTAQAGDDTTGFVDAGGLRKQERRQRMPTEYTNARDVLSEQEQYLLTRAGQSDSQAHKPVSLPARPAGMVERKKARRTVDDLIAEEQKTMKPRFLHHKDQAAEMRLGLQQARATASSFASEKANLHDKRRRSTSEAEERGVKRAKAEPATARLGPFGTSCAPQNPQLNTLSPLHQEIVEFAQEATPSAAENQLVEQVMEAIRSAVAVLWPRASVEKFGSQATNLSMPGSDVDIVILDAGDHSGEMLSKQSNMAALSKLRSQLGKQGILDRSYPVNLIGAKVPIIKCKIRPPGSQHSLRADISSGHGNGVQAAALIGKFVHGMPPLRPLVLILKRLLKEHDMHEVSTGGLSSYSLINMTIAHLQAEGFRMSDDGQPAQHGVSDLGNLLWGFLMRFGDVFDYNDQAISINEGGVISKKSNWRVRFKSWLLAVEDPQQPNKEISGGSYRIKEVKAMFLKAALRLDHAVHKAKLGGDNSKNASDEIQAWADIQADGQHALYQRATLRFPILSSIINAEEALT